MTVLKRSGVVRSLRRALLVALDAIIAAFVFALSLYLAFNGVRGPEYEAAADQLYQILPLFILIYLLLYVIGGVYSVMWRYAGFPEATRFVSVTFIATIIEIALDFMFTLKLPLELFVLSAILMSVFALGVRFIGKLLREMAISRANGLAEKNIGGRILIVGAGEGGKRAVELCRQKRGVSGNPICFADDDVKKHDLRIDGVPVLGTTDDLPSLIRRKGITELIIAMPGIRGERIERVIERCRKSRIPVRVLADGESPEGRLRDITIADFLSKPDAAIDETAVGGYITDSVILITGCGILGAEICRQALKFKPRQVILTDTSETRAAGLAEELMSELTEFCPVEAAVASIRDRARLDEIMAEYKPRAVFHAAAHIDLPMMEKAPAEAIKTNVFGTLNLLEAAEAAGVERFVMISTNKAVNPQSAVGAAMRVAERLVHEHGARGGMRAVSVRVGNIKGAAGGAISVIETEIKSGGPVCISDPEVTRYIISAPEAARLALHAGAMAEGGATYVLNTGEPLRLIDVAHKLIRFFGFTPGVDMPVKVTGLRPGEKLREEMFTARERAGMSTTTNDRIMVAPATEDRPLGTEMDNLRTAAARNDEAAARALAEAVDSRFAGRGAGA